MAAHLEGNEDDRLVSVSLTLTQWERIEELAQIGIDESCSSEKAAAAEGLLLDALRSQLPPSRRNT